MPQVIEDEDSGVVCLDVAELGEDQWVIFGKGSMDSFMRRLLAGRSVAECARLVKCVLYATNRYSRTRQQLQPIRGKSGRLDALRTTESESNGDRGDRGDRGRTQGAVRGLDSLVEESTGSFSCFYKREKKHRGKI